MAADLILYTLLFPTLLRLKVILDLAQFLETEILTTIEVALASLTAVVTLTGIVWLFRERTIAGRYLTIAALSGLFLLVISTMLLLGSDLAPLGLQTYITPGLLIGNVLLVAANVSVFYSHLPAM
jgi:hypothetical protein